MTWIARMTLGTDGGADHWFRSGGDCCPPDQVPDQLQRVPASLAAFAAGRLIVSRLRMRWRTVGGWRSRSRRDLLEGEGDCGFHYGAPTQRLRGTVIAVGGWSLAVANAVQAGSCGVGMPSGQSQGQSLGREGVTPPPPFASSHPGSRDVCGVPSATDTKKVPLFCPFGGLLHTCNWGPAHGLHPCFVVAKIWADGGRAREVLEWPHTVGGGGVPPMDPPQTTMTIVGKKRNLQQKEFCRAIFGTQTFGSQTLPPPFLILPWAEP